MDAIVERKAFAKAKESELVEFSLKNRYYPSHPERVLRRFFTDLVSTENLVFDYSVDGSRVLVASLIDKIENPSNSANLEILGFTNGRENEILFERLLTDAKRSLPQNRSGIELNFNRRSPLPEDFFRKRGFEIHYRTFEMERASVDSPPTFILADGYEWKTLSRENFSDYYSVLKIAFSKNLETSIPPLEEMLKGFATNSTPAVLLYHNQRLIGFASISAPPPAETTGEVHMIGIHPDYRGRGFGKVLLSKALVELKQNNATKIRLTVAAENSDALHLYKKFDFSVVEQDTCLRYSAR